ncbi:DUF4827 domain-containing protein [Prevotella sp. tf2-5]|jgi:hypothetical protein|uniref:DUF4827 domain-containing protein n=1 Tax=Prevotella sp. tf2-5 TaxID=1761889 RepID=UPI0008E0D36E|nr:DUF4827 domain-containing protein [Prevotella sp. tf2-5]SFO73815.1 protein of unknown function [Prevotella sp. tf2-5]
MKKVYSLLVLLCGILFLTSCNKGETYSDLKDAEREAINRYISKNNIKVISQTQFTDQGETTNVANNEYVYLERSGVYMQIVRKGCGEKVKDGETLEILCRFSEYNIKENKLVTRNDIVYFYDASYGNYSSLPDKMMVERIGNTYTGSFVYGLMSYTHSSTSVPAGWLVPLTYVNIGRPVNDDDEIAKVRLIVPHSQGTVDASSSVFPCYYEITYERDK